MIRTQEMKLGTHRNRARFYANGAWLAQAEFAPGRKIAASFEDGQVVIRLDDNGDRKVSQKRGDIPVIDINSNELIEALGSVEKIVVRASAGEIVITPTRVAKMRARRTRNGLEGSAFSGGGMLSEAARQAGFTPAFGVEIDPRFAEVFAENHPQAKLFAQSIHEVELSDVPQVELLTMGICCQPFSNARQARNGQVPEAHELGDMVFWALRLVEACNPWTVVVEEAPAFLNSGAGWVLRHALERMGYTVDARVLDSADFGSLTSRKRAVIIATTDEVVSWPEPGSSDRSLGDVLEDAPESAYFDRSSKSWLFDHWDAQAAKGNGFQSAQLDETSTKVPTITKRYFNQQGTGAVVKHPTKADTFRWLTVAEVAGIMGLPAGYKLPSAKTVAGNILGQGVQVDLFRQVIENVRAA